MLDMDELKEKISDFSLRDTMEEKPFVFPVICLIILLFLAGLIILLIQTSPEKKPAFKEAEPFEAEFPVIIPDTPQIEKDYFPARIPENQWSEKDIDKWFTYPDENVMTDLEKANDKIVNEIIGAAP